MFQISQTVAAEVTVEDLQDYVKVSNTDFSRRVLQIFDEDNSGHVIFPEFVISLWNYCLLDHASLEIFAFDIYDVNSKSFLTVDDIELMLSGKCSMISSQAQVSSTYCYTLLSTCLLPNEKPKLILSSFCFWCFGR